MGVNDDNLRIVTVDGDVFIRTIYENGVHYPFHYTRLFASDGEEYGPSNPVPVALSQVGGSPITIEAGQLNVNLSHEDDSVQVYGALVGGSPVPIAVDADGHLQVDIVSGAYTQYEVDNVPPANYVGTVAVGLQPGSPGPLAANGSYAPLQFNNQGALLVSLGTNGASGTFQTADSPAKTVTVVNGYITSIS